MTLQLTTETAGQVSGWHAGPYSSTGVWYMRKWWSLACGGGIIGLFDVAAFPKLTAQTDLMSQLPVECAAALLLYDGEQKEAGEGDVSVLLPFPHRRLWQTDTRHSRLWCESFTTGRGSPTCEVSETPPHIKKDEMERRRRRLRFTWACWSVPTQSGPSARIRPHKNVPSETKQTDKCVLTVWTQAFKTTVTFKHSQTLTGNVCRTTPGGMVCVCVCVRIQLTMFPCSSTELLPKTERNTKVDQLCGNRCLHYYFSLSVLDSWGLKERARYRTFMVPIKMSPLDRISNTEALTAVNVSTRKRTDLFSDLNFHHRSFSRLTDQLFVL